MKIIVPGRHPRDRMYRHTCTACKTLFEFKQSEGRIQNDREGDFVSVNCPLCTANCWVGLHSYIKD